MASKEEVLALHKKQQRDLIANITSLKKQATKKTRKNVLIQCQNLQDDLDYKQKLELEAFEGEGEQGEPAEDVTPEQLLQQLEISKGTESPGDSVDTPVIEAPKKKPNRQKQRLAKRQQKIDDIKAQASLEAENTVDYRAIEIESMNQLLQFNSLKIHDILPDGNCLFASIKHQVETRHQDLSDDYQLNEVNENFPNLTLQDYRQLAGDYILANKPDFVPFLFDEVTGECKDIDDYVYELTHSSMWGSDMEILALAKTFNCPIHIHLAGASTMVINETGQLPTLKLGYFKHSYGLGEHYNSLIDDS